MVLELHGSGFTPEAQMAASGFAGLADRLGFRVLAPEAAIPFHYAGQAAPGFAWHVPGVPLFGQTGVEDDWPDDIAFVAALIESLAREGEPVFVAGFSGGGRLAAHLALRLGDRIGAIGTVAGLVLPPDDGQALPPEPIIAFHGTADTINPYADAVGPRWPAGVAATAGGFARRFDWQSYPDRSGAHSRDLYIDADGRLRLLQWTISGGGHSWPGSCDAAHHAAFGTPVAEVDATMEMWRFFMGEQRNG